MYRLGTRLVGYCCCGVLMKACASTPANGMPMKSFRAKERYASGDDGYDRGSAVK